MSIKEASKKNSFGIAIVLAVVGVSFLCFAFTITKNDSKSNGLRGGQGGQGEQGDPFYTPKVVGCVKTLIDQNLLDWDLPSYGVAIEEDVVYGKGAVKDGNEVDLKLDIYRPSTNDNLKHPLMIHIHGGSFKGGDKGGRSTGTESSAGWAKRGFIVASINYRLAGDNPVLSAKSNANALTNYITEQSSGNDPIMAIVASLEDTLAAYDYMKSMSYVDAEVVVLNGYSAGAITSLWTTYGIDNFDYDRPPIKAVISHWGSLVEEEEEVKKLIPTVDVPTFLVHATGDSVVSYSGTQLLANRFETLGMPYVLHCRDSGDHSIAIDSVEHQNGVTILEAEQYWLRNILQDA
jgi:predicted esterase